jgi:hypothetical protein
MSGNNEGFDSFQPGVAQVGKISWSYDPANFSGMFSTCSSENGLMRSSADRIVVSRDKGNSSARRKF